MSINTIRSERVFPDHPEWRLVTRYQPKERHSSVHGLMGAGWRWHVETTAPNGEIVVGIVRGPYETEEQCMEDAGFDKEKLP